MRWIVPALLLGVPLLALPLPALRPAHAVEIGGATTFIKGPWKADLISYQTTVGEAPVWYYLTVALDAGAGAALSRLTLEQTRGVDRTFPFSSGLTRAFLGWPRREGRWVPVQATFEADARRISIDFPEPVRPGETVTVVLRPWTNPMQADTYMFSVVAWPEGPNPTAWPVGFATLRIYDRSLF